MFQRFLAALTRNVISLIGTALTTAGALLIIGLFSLGLLGAVENPYIGILAYLVLPAIFLLGLVLIPIGIWRQRKRDAGVQRDPRSALPVVDLNQPRTRELVLLVGLLTIVNVVILGTASYKGVEVMDSTAFCGATCHSVMTPEYTAYRRSPHARVKCVACHIGPGADWFVKSKLSGAWQVVATAFDLYPRPIPTPIHNLRPARETCEQCHWPTKFVGDRLKVITHYSDDEANTGLKTVLLMRVGGVEGRKSQGIHWHVDPAIRIRYLSDESREHIHEVELTRADGTVLTFTRPGEKDGVPAEGEAAESPQGWRVMDCVDCHNRPTHIYRMPEDAIDAAIEQGRIDRSLPYVRREGLKLLREDYASHEEARRSIADRLGAFYSEQYPQLAADGREKIEQASRVLGDLFCTNVFPSMKVEWGTYPSHIGHMNDPGCFRCHDDELQASDGQTVPQDCDTCHTLLAMEEKSPEVLKTLQP